MEDQRHHPGTVAYGVPADPGDPFLAPLPEARAGHPGAKAAAVARPAAAALEALLAE